MSYNKYLRGINGRTDICRHENNPQPLNHQVNFEKEDIALKLTKYALTHHLHPYKVRLKLQIMLIATCTSDTT